METQFVTEEEISDYERERGKPLPGVLHSFVQMNLIQQLARSNGESYEFLPELNIELNGYKAVPDITIFDKNESFLRSRVDIEWVTAVPLVTIEISAPRQPVHSLIVRAEEYLKRGVQEAWVIIAEIQTLTVCKPHHKRRTYTSGSVRHEGSRATISIEELFAD